MLGIAILIPVFNFIQNKLSNEVELKGEFSVNFINEFFQLLNINQISSILLLVVIFFTKKHLNFSIKLTFSIKLFFQMIFGLEINF